MRRYVASALIALGITACGSSHAAHHVTVHHATPGPTAVAGGCGSTSLRRGVLPGWAKPAFAAGGSPTSPWPYGVAEHGNVVAVVFGYPLRAGRPTNSVNKVLWIMRQPRRGSPLSVSATPLGGGGPSVHESWPADSSPGEIYPSYVNVPRAGCWHVTLKWAHHTDSIDLRYRA